MTTKLQRQGAKVKRFMDTFPKKGGFHRDPQKGTYKVILPSKISKRKTKPKNATTSAFKTKKS